MLSRGGVPLLVALALSITLSLGGVRAQACATANGLTIAYSTLWSGQGAAVAEAVARDHNGTTYVTGLAAMPDGVPNKAFVAAYSPSGALLSTRTIPNGGCNAIGKGIAVDARGNVYVAGQAGAMSEGKCKYNQIFVAKLDPRGTLAYNVRLGRSTSSDETATAMAVDARGNAYVTGQINTDIGFPATPGAFQTDPGKVDMGPFGPSTSSWSDVPFVTKLDGAGHVAYSTFLSGTGKVRDAEAHGIAVDAHGDAFVTGDVASADFPVTANAFGRAWPSGAERVAFVSKLDPAGAHLLYSTIFGGGDHTYSYGIALDGAGRAYIAGKTGSMDLPTTPGAYQRTCGRGGNAPEACNIATACHGQYQDGNDYYHTCDSTSFENAFVALFDPDPALPGPRTLAYATYLGGNLGDRAQAIAVIRPGRVAMCGFTTSTNFPIRGAVQSALGGGQNGFVSLLDLTRRGDAALLASTYLGGGKSDDAQGIVVDAAGDAYVAGGTLSPTFPRVGAATSLAADPARGAAFLVKLSPGAPLDVSAGGSTGGDGSPAPRPDGAFTVTGAGLLHDVHGKGVVTAALHRGEDGLFVALYSAQGSAAPTGQFHHHTGEPHDLPRGDAPGRGAGPCLPLLCGAGGRSGLLRGAPEPGAGVH